jgi:TATA element modulatory factor
VQAKLVRQIETLQSSYSVASENWRGIESTLLARISDFEKEQTESSKKEADLRRKLREMSSRHKELESRLEIATNQIQDLEESLARETDLLTQTKAALAKAESESQSAHAELKSAKESWEARLERLESEKRESPFDAGSLRSRNHSPVLRSGFEPPTPRRFPGSPGLGFSSNTLGFPERPGSRRASAQAPQPFLPHRQGSSTSMTQASVKSSIPETPIIQTEGPDEYFDEATPATPERTINDMLSTSTAAAGPSVQLVERMSAAVRRLESEKAVSKDELDRLSTQRDEARNQVVALMREVEEKKGAEARVKKLEEEIEEINLRLQTTLEMLGEKSEMVEELKADILDMKEIYKATLENTVK